jgi:hypothetical protein
VLENFDDLEPRQRDLQSGLAQVFAFHLGVSRGLSAIAYGERACRERANSL